jgi:hypothetical protein
LDGKLSKKNLDVCIYGHGFTVRWLTFGSFSLPFLSAEEITLLAGCRNVKTPSPALLMGEASFQD